MYTFVFKSITGAITYTSIRQFDAIDKAQSAGHRLAKYATATDSSIKGHYIDVISV